MYSFSYKSVYGIHIKRESLNNLFFFPIGRFRLIKTPLFTDSFLEIVTV